jgi:hypothetical protein
MPLGMQIINHLHPMELCNASVDLCTSSPAVYVAAFAGMEAVVANLLEPGDKIIVGVNGIWWVACAVSDHIPTLGSAVSCQCIVGQRLQPEAWQYPSKGTPLSE